MIAVSDTGPLLYLSLIDCTDLLPRIFEKVLIPRAVAEELSDSSTPPQTSSLIERQPDWLHICTVSTTDPSLQRLGLGEREAITLVLSASADVLLTDDAAARRIATQTCDIAASGTIGVLYEAARDVRVPFTATDFDRAIERLQRTSFYAGSALQQSIEDLNRRLHAGEVRSEVS
jgi:predicted nucleic acid-binding protein